MSLSPYLLAFTVLLILAAILWTISCYGLRRAKSRTISHLKRFAEQTNALHTFSIFLDYDCAKGELRNHGFEFKLYERMGAWLLLTVFLSKQADFYLRIARKSLRELIVKGKEVRLEGGDLLPFLETMIALKTNDAEKARMLLHPGVQAIVLRLFEDFKIARLELDGSEIRITISDAEITGEEYFKSMLELALDFAEEVEKQP